MLKTYIKAADLVAEMPAHRLHFGKKYSNRTLTGGICTIIASLLFLILATYQGFNIL